MTKPMVGIVLGSRADFNAMRRCLESLRTMGVPYLLEISSPHKTPDKLTRFAQTAGDEGIELLICAAAGTGHVAGVLASYTTLPVIAVPLDSSPFRGEDALLGMSQMPPGVPVATVGVNGAENAAILAVEILALKYPRFRAVLAHNRLAMAQKIDGAERELLAEFAELCDPAQTTPITKPPPSDADTDPGPEADTPDAPSGERIAPGAVFVGKPKPIALNPFVMTPTPHEPATAETPRDDDEPASNGAAPADTAKPLPSPPSDDDFGIFALLGSEAITEAMPVVSERKHSAKEKRKPLPETPAKGNGTLDTKLFTLDPADPDQDVLSHAMMVLFEGGIVAFPTDTVYGLAVDATNAESVRRLYEVKGHTAATKSLSILIHDVDVLEKLVKEVPAPAESLLTKFWPGGLTIVFAKHPSVLSSVTESPSIAIRVPNDPLALKLMTMFGRPLAVINAALPDTPAAVSGQQVIDRFDTRIDCVLDAGTCKSGKTSTVLSVITEPYEVLREGAIPTEDLKRVLGDRIKEI